MAHTAQMEGQAHHGGVPPVHLVVRLELTDKPTREFSYDFRQDVITLGRDPGNDIQIPLTTVSRLHSRIFYELSDFFLEDLGSTHGTHHNGKKLATREKKLLRDGDRIEIMSFSIVFKTTPARVLDRQPGEKTEQLARRMVQEVLASLSGSTMEPTSLRVMNGLDEGRRFEIRDEQSEIVIGRSPDCEVVLRDQNASRRHCLVKRTWNGFVAQDLGSKNGVLLNGQRIDGAREIKDGDELQVGSIKLTFIDPASRILDQFGGFSEETVNPGRVTDAPEEAAAEEAYGEEQGHEAEEGYDDGGYTDDSDDSSAASEESYDPGDEPSQGEDSGEEEEARGGEGLGDLSAPVTRGIGAEVAILVFGLVFLAGAVLIGVFLFL